jgi:hypothetical protein
VEKFSESEFLMFVNCQNSFYLPLLSALAVLSVSHDGNTYKDGSLFMALYALGFLTLIKMDTLFTIKSLIKQL